MRRMRENQNRITARLLLALTLLCASQPVFAYLDPTTGSMVISAIVGIFASIALALKTYWYKVKRWFTSGEKRPVKKNDPADPSAD